MTEQQIEQSIQDFKVFLVYVWKHLRLPRPTRMQLHIADYLQHGHKRSQLQALRGIGKTWITGSFVCWRLLRNPNEKVLIVSQTGGHADNIAIFIRTLINTMDILSHLKPRVDQRGSVTSFDVNGCEISVQPSVKALGITSQLQGNRASLLISDDVEGQQNSATEVRREQLLKQIAEYEAILQTDDNSQILVLGTPQTSESIYNRLRLKGYITRIYPAIYPEDIDKYNGCLADYIVEDLLHNPSLVGKSIDSRFTDEDLFNRQLSYGLSGFKLQYQLDTTLSDSERFPLKTKDIVVTDLSPTTTNTNVRYSSLSSNVITDIPNVGFSGDTLHRGTSDSNSVKYEGRILAIDPSGRGSDKTGVAIVSHCQGNLYIPYIGHTTGGYDMPSLIELAQLAKEYEVEEVVIEGNFGDGMFEALLTPVLNSIYPCRTTEVKHSIQKERRIIDTLEPLLNQHRLVFDYSNLLNDTNKALTGNSKDLQHSFLFQLTHITRDRNSLAHDDVLDALALGVSYWNDRNVLKLDINKALEAYKQKQIQDEINRRVNIYNQQRNIKPVRQAVKHLKAFKNR